MGVILLGNQAAAGATPGSGYGFAIVLIGVMVALAMVGVVHVAWARRGQYAEMLRRAAKSKRFEGWVMLIGVVILAIMSWTDAELAQFLLIFPLAGAGVYAWSLISPESFPEKKSAATSAIGEAKGLPPA
jgi:hypothetical protein